MRVSRYTLYLDAAAWLFFGVWLFAYPKAMESVGLTLSDVGHVEIRAFYGGMELGIGAFVLWVSRQKKLLKAGLVFNLLAFGGLAAGRAIGAAIAGGTATIMYQLLALEAAAAIWNAAVLWRYHANR